MKIDWEALREQKAWLLNSESPHADGLMHLIEALQDEAVTNGTPEEEVFGDPFANSFMKPCIYHAGYYEVETTSGTEIVPLDVCGLADDGDDLVDYLEGAPHGDQVLDLKHGYLARMSAPGYMDCTSWSAHGTYQQAMDYLKDMYADY